MPKTILPLAMLLGATLLAVPVQARMNLETPEAGPVAPLSFENTRGKTTLHEAAHANRPQILRFLFERGDDLDAQDEIGFTPLHWAAHAGSGKSLNMLLHLGANPQIRSRTGERPLDIADLRRTLPEEAHERLIRATYPEDQGSWKKILRTGHAVVRSAIHGMESVFHAGFHAGSRLKEHALAP